MLRKWIFLPLLLLGVPLSAQVAFTSFPEVLEYADDHAISLKGAGISEEIAASGKKEARGYLLPTVNASAGYNDNITLLPTLIPATIFNPNAPDGTFQELVFGRRFLYNASLQAQWDILNFQRLFAAQTANLQAESSQINTEKTRFSTYNQLASTYYSILLNQESIEILEKNVKTSSEILESAEEKYKNGVISEGDLNRAKINHLRGESGLSTSRNTLEQLYLQLQTQLNLEEELIIQDSPDQFNIASTTFEKPHIEIAWQEAEVGKYASLLRQKKAQHIPTLSFVYQYNYNWATDNLIDFSEANELPQQVFGVKLNVPVFRGGSIRQQVQQSQKELQWQEMQLQHLRLAKQKEDELLRLQLEQAAEQHAHNKQILKLQEQSDVHAENQYQSGIISLDTRLTQYDELLMIQDQYLQSLAALTLARYKIYIRNLDFEPTDR